MKRLALLIAAALLLTPVALKADQRDPQLDGLFARLHGDIGSHEAEVLEQRIWAIWLRHDDEKVNALMELGVLEMSRGHREDALATFDLMIESAPDFAEAWNKRATLHYLMGEYESSLADIEETLALEPRHFGALSGRGLVLMALERWEEAYAAFQETLAVNPHARGARANMRYLEETYLGQPL